MGREAFREAFREAVWMEVRESDNQIGLLAQPSPALPRTAS